MMVRFNPSLDNYCLFHAYVKPSFKSTGKYSTCRSKSILAMLLVVNATVRLELVVVASMLQRYCTISWTIQNLDWMGFLKIKPVQNSHNSGISLKQMQIMDQHCFPKFNLYTMRMESEKQRNVLLEWKNGKSFEHVLLNLAHSQRSILDNFAAWKQITMPSNSPLMRNNDCKPFSSPACSSTSPACSSTSDNKSTLDGDSAIPALTPEEKVWKKSKC